MKRLLIAVALGVAAAAAPTLAAQAVADMKPPAKWAPARKTMEKNGRFHYLHVVKQKVDCSDCHADQSKDIMFLRNTEAPPAGLAAHVDRADCLECHQGAKKPTWYGARPQ
jgi:nitrate/TMAO reductase-like tetraheme cytochrome c subunit